MHELCIDVFLKLFTASTVRQNKAREDMNPWFTGRVNVSSPKWLSQGFSKTVTCRTDLDLIKRSHSMQLVCF